MLNCIHVQRQSGGLLTNEWNRWANSTTNANWIDAYIQTNLFVTKITQIEHIMLKMDDRYIIKVCLGTQISSGLNTLFLFYFYFFCRKDGYGSSAFGMALKLDPHMFSILIIIILSFIARINISVITRIDLELKRWLNKSSECGFLIWHNWEHWCNG